MPIQPTTDLCDALGADVRVLDPLFRDFGARRSFAGRIATVLAPEDNSKVKEALSEPGNGRVLVVEGFASRNCAFVGGNLGVLAVKNGWAGIVVHGFVRDSDELAACDLGIRAMGAYPRKTEKRNAGERDVVVQFAGVTFRPGEWLCADADGIVVCATEPA